MKDWGDLERFFPPQARTAAEKGCLYLLERLQRDANVYWYCGAATGAFEVLCRGEAEVTGEPIEAVKKRRSRCFDDRVADVERLKARIAELESELERRRP